MALIVKSAGTTVPGAASPGRGASRFTGTPSFARTADVPKDRRSAAAATSPLITLNGEIRIGASDLTTTDAVPTPFAAGRFPCWRSADRLIVDQAGRAEPDRQREERRLAFDHAVELAERCPVRNADVRRSRERLVGQNLPHRPP